MEVGGSKVLIQEFGGEVYAVSNKCSHLGLPLEVLLFFETFNSHMDLRVRVTILSDGSSREDGDGNLAQGLMQAKGGISGINDFCCFVKTLD